MVLELSPSPEANLLLAGFPAPERERLLGRGELVNLRQDEILYEPGAPINAVYFPTTSLISLTLALPGCVRSEIAMIGRDGLAGLPVVLGQTVAPRQAVVQVPGQALRVPSETFVALARPGSEIDLALRRYTHTFITELSISAACARCHSVDERAARYLLTIRDRVARDEFPLKQAFLGQMLGVRRQTTSTATRRLLGLEAIRYSRARMAILNAEELLTRTCACYQLIRDAISTLVHPSHGGLSRAPGTP
jgi:CRP-like cAMP-binding protein